MTKYTETETEAEAPRKLTRAEQAVERERKRHELALHELNGRAFAAQCVAAFRAHDYESARMHALNAAECAKAAALASGGGQ